MAEAGAGEGGVGEFFQREQHGLVGRRGGADERTEGFEAHRAVEAQAADGAGDDREVVAAGVAVARGELEELRGHGAVAVGGIDGEQAHFDEAAAGRQVAVEVGEFGVEGKRAATAEGDLRDHAVVAHADEIGVVGVKLVDVAALGIGRVLRDLLDKSAVIQAVDLLELRGGRSEFETGGGCHGASGFGRCITFGQTIAVGQEDERDGGGERDAGFEAGQEPRGGGDAPERGGEGEREAAAGEDEGERGGRAGGESEERVEGEAAAEEGAGAPAAAEAQGRGPDVAGHDGGQSEDVPGRGGGEPAGEEDGEGRFGGVEGEHEEAETRAEDAGGIGGPGDAAAVGAEIAAGFPTDEPPAGGEAAEGVSEEKGEGEHREAVWKPVAIEMKREEK